jgi:hypothetical protein
VIIRRIRNLVEELSLLVLYPLALLTIGILIHVYGLLQMAAGSEPFDVGTVWVHAFMLLFNGLVLIGLITMKKAAYRVLIAGLVLMAATWTVDAVLRREINLSTLLGIVLCTIAVPVTAVLYRMLSKNRRGMRSTGK